MKVLRNGSRPASGRKPAGFLRALARELGTSHRLLGYYLKHWHEWEGHP